MDFLNHTFAPSNIFFFSDIGGWIDRTIELTVSLIQALEAPNIKIGIIAYGRSSETQVLINLGQNNTSSMISAVQGMSKGYPWDGWGLTASYARNMFRDYGRANVVKIIVPIVLYEGNLRSNDFGRAMLADGTYVVPIAVTNRNLQGHLNNLATIVPQLSMFYLNQNNEAVKEQTMGQKTSNKKSEKNFFAEFS